MQKIKEEHKDMDLRSLIQVMKKQFALALPKHLTPDRFMRVCLTAVNKNPKLLACSKESVLACLMDCSQFGLEPDGRKAHLIPYGPECKLIFDYKGLVELARRSGEISYVHADIVCENDEFSYAYGSGAHLKHVPAQKDRGEVKLGYSFVKLRDGSEDFTIMNKDEIIDIQERSEGWRAYKAKKIKSNPWATDWNEMAKKTVFRRHSKWLPLSSEFQEAVEKDFDLPEEVIDLERKVAPAIEVPAEELKPVHVDANEGPYVTNGKIKVIKDLGKAAGLSDFDLFDILTERNIPAFESIPESKYEELTKVLAKLVDEKKAK